MDSKRELTVKMNKKYASLRNTKHGMSNTKFYSVWSSMRARCNSPKNKHYPSYGGQGIGVCESWDKFENFKDDMLGSYNEALAEHGDGNVSLERVDNDGGYSPENCIWIRRGDQIKNRRNPMTFQIYQKEARKSALYPFVDENLVYVVLGLAGEAGEISNVVKKIIRDDGGNITTMVRDKLILEIGDVLWYIAATCSELNISMDEVARRNLQKLSKRLDEGSIKGSGDDR